MAVIPNKSINNLHGNYQFPHLINKGFKMLLILVLSSCFVVNIQSVDLSESIFDMVPYKLELDFTRGNVSMETCSLDFDSRTYFSSDRDLKYSTELLVQNHGGDFTLLRRILVSNNDTDGGEGSSP